MNDYWIHYTGKNGDDCTTGVTERTMDSARRAFTVAHEGADIQCIVLLGKHTYTTKAEAYAAMQEQYKTVEKYLQNKKITKIEKKTVNGYYNYKRDANGAYTNIPESYNFSQPVTISSDNVELIKEISNDITGLISQGIDINVYAVSYNYSKLPELKVSLLEKASVDAKNRAASMLKATHNSVGKIQSVRMGVYQITPVDSTDVSDMGINDATTIDKKVTAVANISFKIK